MKKRPDSAAKFVKQGECTGHSPEFYFPECRPVEFSRREIEEIFEEATEIGQERINLCLNGWHPSMTGLRTTKRAKEHLDPPPPGSYLG